MSSKPGTKLFYKIGEVGRLAGVEPYILRYWESEFPALSPKKNRGGQRVYLHRDLEMVIRIKRMLHEEGYTVAGARKKLAEGRGAKGAAEIKAAGTLEPKESGLADTLGRFKKDIEDLLDLVR